MLNRSHGGKVRLLVLEHAIRRTLHRNAPVAGGIADVLPHPINPAEAREAEANHLTAPLRFGLVGQATKSKGITPFLDLAQRFALTHPDGVRFHVVGNAPVGTDMAPFAVLDDPVPFGHLDRAEFLRKIRRLHYVCLLLQHQYYALSASGALMDALIWLRPVIATRVPIIVDLFDRFGDIGELCDDVDAAYAAIARLADHPDPARYERQVENLRRARESRLPSGLAGEYRALTETGFPGLLSQPAAAPAMVTSHG
jgi:hypothetical protein